jgi:hypothetical protein
MTDSGEYRYNCPFCPIRAGKIDKKYRLYVNTKKVLYGIVGWYYCHRCKSRGPVKRLTPGGQDVDDIISRYEPSKWSDFVNSLKGERAFIDEEEALPRFDLPVDYSPIVYGTEAYEYLKSRRISDEQIEAYQIGFGTEHLRDLSPEERKLYIGSGRVVFPDYDDIGELTYWVARSYRNHKLRYKNPAGSGAMSKIYNLARAAQYKTVIITEGVFSSIASGYNAVGTYGKNITNQQFSMLAAVAFDRYVVALDGDAKGSAVGLADGLARRGCKGVFLVEFSKDEDPASISDMGFRVKNAVPFTFHNRLYFTMS